MQNIYILILIVLLITLMVCCFKGAFMAATSQLCFSHMILKKVCWIVSIFIQHMFNGGKLFSII